MEKHVYVHPTWFRYLIGYFVVSIFPLILLTFITNHYFQTIYRNEALNSMMNSMEYIGHTLESTMQQSYSVAVQISRLDAFSAENIENNPVAFMKIQQVLEDYRNTNNNLQDIVYYNVAHPDVFYTTYGTYLSMYYKWYVDRLGNAIPARDLYPLLNPVQGMLYVDIQHSRIAFGQSLDFICRLPETTGAYLTFSLSYLTLGRMLGQSEPYINTIILLDAEGNSLYAWSRQGKQSLEPLLYFAQDVQDHQYCELPSGDYMLKANSPSKTFTLLYGLSPKSFYGRLVRLRNNLLILFMCVSMATGAITFHLMQKQVRPLIELVQLVERILHVQTNQKRPSEFDQIREAILFIHRRNEQLSQQTEIQHRENKRLKALVEPAESVSKPADLIQKAMVFIDSRLGDDRLNATFVADNLSCTLSNLSHQFKATTNHTLSDYIVARKLTYACKQLEETDEPVMDIASRLGYSQSSSFIRVFKSVYGVTPNEYRKKRSS